MSKKYTFEVVINEGNDEFWENISNSGCDEVTSLLENALENVGLFNGENVHINLLEFSNKE